MINIETLRKNYASMEDFQLMQICKEASSLSQDGFIVLKKEIIKRGLDRTLIDEQEKLRVDEKIEKVNQNIKKENKKFAAKILNLVFLRKKGGLTNQQIIDELVSEGVEPESAKYLTSNIEQMANELLHDANNGVQGSLVWFGIAIVGGVAIGKLGLSNTFLFYFLAVTLIRGFVLLYTSSAHKSFLVGVLQVIENEKLQKEG